MLIGVLGITDESSKTTVKNLGRNMIGCKKAEVKTTLDISDRPDLYVELGRRLIKERIKAILLACAGFQQEDMFKEICNKCIELRSKGMTYRIHGLSSSIEK